jgi:membrane-associated protease RseP (regulator of RpoE activity)
MIAYQRGPWLVLAVLGLVLVPGWCLAQSSDAENLQKQLEAQRQALQAAEVRLRAYSALGFGTSRLGATTESPSAAVAAQLDLPKGQGQVVKNVQANSAAAKAGIQANDILLELDGKPVSSNMQEFQKNLNDIKPDSAIEAVVVRKGQKTTLKGLTLPKADQTAQFGRFLQPTAPALVLGQTIMNPPVPGQLLPTDIQGQLKLTPEQKEKLTKLQKETEAKVMELLTDEQKKQLEELKKANGLRRVPQPGQPQEEIRKRGEELKKQQQYEIQKKLEESRKQLKEQQDQIQVQVEAAQLQAQAAQDLQDLVVKLRAVRGVAANRLGAALETPSDALANQLNLPQGQGIVLKNVPADSAAGKAGFQANDILLELGGKTITRNPAEFDKTVESIKADTAVDAVVLRKGEKTTVKGVSLPAAAAAVRPALLRTMTPAKVPGELLPMNVQDQLKLTAEQKDKLSKLQKDTEAKLIELLTEEQKKKLDELKKAPGVPLKIIINGTDIEIPNK